ncbi:hypothetical protein CEXT_221241 [Caerostris extrusa]|uniref:Uncharacterized protein n=1 Tax=Caerostris extrusa TaxID=172846 RepID=A0AAV4UHY9_CAEEX|nr:hypothetical protein CEXT_221241 [Caerostris extrusa]
MLIFSKSGSLSVQTKDSPPLRIRTGQIESNSPSIMKLSGFRIVSQLYLLRCNQEPVFRITPDPRKPVNILAYLPKRARNRSSYNSLPFM